LPTGRARALPVAATPQNPNPPREEDLMAKGANPPKKETKKPKKDAKATKDAKKK
jgi:hypothetical protein